MPADDPTVGRPTATDHRTHINLTVDLWTAPGKFDQISDQMERAATRDLLCASVAVSTLQGGDGHVQVDTVLEYADLPFELAKTLLVNGSWHGAGHTCPRCPQPRDGHVYVHDYLEHHHSAAELERRRNHLRNAGAKGRETRWGNRPPAAALPAAATNQPKRGPGRPRKHPLPGVGSPVTPPSPAAAVAHPAEARARAGNAKPRAARTKAEPKVYEPIVHELCSLLAGKVRENGFTATKQQETSVGWLEACRLMLEKDGRTERQITNMIKWSQDDFFWYKNIRGMPNLREKYERMREDTKDPNRAKVVRNADGVAGPTLGATRRRGEAPPAVPTAKIGNRLYGAGSNASAGGLLKKGVA